MSPDNNIELLLSFLGFILAIYFVAFILEFLRSRTIKYLMSKEWFAKYPRKALFFLRKIKPTWTINYIKETRIYKYLYKKFDFLDDDEYFSVHIMTPLTTITLMAVILYAVLLRGMTPDQGTIIALIHLVLLCIFTYRNEYRDLMTDNERFYHDRMMILWFCIIMWVISGIIIIMGN